MNSAATGEARPGGGRPEDRVWTWPNALSFARILGVPIFLWLIVTHRDGWALTVLIVSSITDYVDGYLARRFDQVTTLGASLDPIADRLYIFTALIGLTARGFVPWWFTALLVARDLVGLILVARLRRRGYRGFPVIFLGKAATFCLLYAFPLLIVGDWSDSRLGAVALALGWAFAWWGLVLYWIAVLVYAVQAREIVALDSGRGTPEPGLS